MERAISEKTLLSPPFASVYPGDHLPFLQEAWGPQPSITFCLIVKNEAHCLERCLESLASVATEIIIVDTGSTDGTVEIAQQYGKVLHHVWNDDFAAARNVALAHATGAWIGIVDADETLPTATAQLLPTYLNRPEFQNRPVVLNWRVCSEHQQDLFSRGLFPNGYGIRFAGRVHEIPVLTHGTLASYNCQELVLQHHTSPEQALSKEIYYQSLLKLDLDDAADPVLRVHAQKHLGLSYVALEEWQSAWEMLSECYVGMQSVGIAPQDGFYGEVLRGLVQSGLALRYAQTQTYALELNHWYPLEPLGLQALATTPFWLTRMSPKSMKRWQKTLIWVGLGILSACQALPALNQQSGFVVSSYGSGGTPTPPPVTCGPIPSPTPSFDPSGNPSSNPSGFPSSNPGGDPQPSDPSMLTFPQLVPPQTLAAVNKPDAKSRFWWIRFVVPKEVAPQAPQTEITTGDEDENPAQTAEEAAADPAPDNAPHKHRVWIPENGCFKVNLIAGARFEVTDNDARDGSATIILPSEILDGFLQLQGPKSKDANKKKPAVDRKLNMQESLYYVDQLMSRYSPGQGKQPWLKFGKRPFPIPASWNTTEGPQPPESRQYVLTFTNQGVQQFVTRWYRTNAGDKPTFPVGMQEIGSAGGTVELPNVGRMEMPAGAVDVPTVIKMTQVLKVESTEKEFATSMHFPEGEWLPGYDFITPVVRLEPFELKLKKAALLHLPIDTARVGNNDLRLIKNAASSTAKNGDWSMDEYWDPLGSPEAPAPYGIQRPIKINTLVYFAKQFPNNIHPNQGVRVKYKTLYLSSPEK